MAEFFSQLCQFFGFGSPLSGDPEAERAARSAADTWLALVDRQEYGESWQSAAALFRRAISKEQWQQTLTSLKEPLGATLSREFQSSRYATSLPGAPDGDYVVIQYQTRFQHKQSAVETVTPMLDPDGQWRVSGYYLK